MLRSVEEKGNSENKNGFVNFTEKLVLKVYKTNKL